MGNRAVIAFTNSAPDSKCIYLHWNGGLASVKGFLGAARELGICHLDRRWGRVDEERAMQQLGTLIGRAYFGKDPGFTVYVEDYRSADKDNGDNGLYLIDSGFHIVGRKFAPRHEEIDPLKTAAIHEQIVARAPIFND